jgi:hypothetical protein
MKLKDIYALSSTPVFGVTASYQDFNRAWFENILELRFHTQELDEDALAGAGRLTAGTLVSMCDDDGERGSDVTVLAFDGVPFALHGTGGENKDTSYMLVTDVSIYQSAESHVRDFLIPASGQFYDVASVDEDRSLEELFGFYYQDMADAARTRVQEHFGDQAVEVLANEAAERAEGYILTRGSRVLHAPTEQMVNSIIVGYQFEGEPAPYLRRGNTLLEKQGVYDDPLAAVWKQGITHIREWYLYLPVKQAAAGATIVRV